MYVCMLNVVVVVVLVVFVADLNLPIDDQRRSATLTTPTTYADYHQMDTES